MSRRSLVLIGVIVIAAIGIWLMGGSLWAAIVAMHQRPH